MSISTSSPGRGLRAFVLAVAFSLSLKPVLADVITGKPDSAPAGFEEWVSPVVVPAIPVQGSGDWADAVAKARHFLAQLTLEEKVNLTTGTGVLNRCVGNSGEITRIGFKGHCYQDSPLGVRFTDFVSAFPTGINAATTWDRNLIFNRGLAMGAEHKSKGVNFALGPMMNLGRAPAAGRNWEGFGADPFLTGVAAAETIKGMQTSGVIATAKHLVANEQEHFRGGSMAKQVYSADVDDKTMHELYIWPFAESIQAGVGAVMCSYNKINQTQACQNSKVMNGIIKSELGFQGPIMSDWAAMIEGVQPALAGLDIDMPGFPAYGTGPQGFDPLKTNNTFWGMFLVEAVRNGSVPESRVDDMVTRLMAAFYKMGQDKDYPAVNMDQLTQDTFNAQGELINEHVNAQGDHYKIIREIAAASAVLLKNEKKALPLNVNKLKRIAIIGNDAGPNPDGPNGCSDRGCDQGHLAMGWGSGTAQFPYLIDPLSAIQTYVHSKRPTVVIEGMLDDSNYAQAQSIASQADTCLVFVSTDSGEAYINVGGNQGDRNNLTTWHAGDTLIQMTAQVCSNTIVVTNFVGAVIMEPWIDHPNVTAVIHAGLAGQESGNGLVDVMFGAVNPSGRLPFTIAKQPEDYGADVLYTSDMETPQVVYSEGINIDYRHFDANNIEPRFEFGFGLSYTNFAYNGLRIRRGGANNNKRAVGNSSIPATAASNSPTPVSSNLTATATSPFRATSIASSLNATSTSAANSTSSLLTSLVSPNATSTANSTNSIATATPTSLPPVSNHPGGPPSLYETAFTVTYTITNTGGVDGNEVSQVYLGFPPEAHQPPKILRGFERSFVKHGQTVHVEIPLRKKDISYWNVIKQKWVIPSGKFTVFVGSSSRKIHLRGTFVA